MINIKNIHSVARILLIAIAVLNLGRGLFHAFAPDSGAGTVAHLDLTTNAENIIFLIAMIGVRQISIGLFQLLIAFRAKHFIFHAFVIDFIMLLMPKVIDKPPSSTFPGMFAHNIELLIVSLFLIAFFFSKKFCKQ